MIKQKKKLCKCGCNREGFIWSKGMLKECFFRLNKLKTIKKYSEKGLERKKEKKKWLNNLHTWELELWDSLEDKNGYVYCYETGTPMHRNVYRQNLCVYSHCLPKSKYPEYAMEKWNLLIILPDVHSLWEINPQKCLKMWTYTEKLKEKYVN